MKHTRTAGGMRRRILLGFTILGCLLFFSGAVSFFELMKLTRSAQGIMDSNRMDIEFSRKMLDAAQEQNTALLGMVSGAVAGNDSVIFRGRDLFEEAFREAASMHDNTERLSAVREAVNAYNGTVDRIFADSARSENLAWFSEVYGNSYRGLTLAVKDFMLSTQDAVDENTLLLRDNAYRAITPGVITLGIALILIIVFFGLLDVYYIKPVVRITRGLGNFIKSRIPFSVKIEGRDEILELRDNIEDIIDIVKKKD